MNQQSSNNMFQRQLVYVYWWLAYIFVNMMSVQADCPSLVAAPNMTISALTAKIGDPPSVISCDPGYKLDSGRTTKKLACVSSTLPEQWNDTVGLCEKKLCPDIGLYLGSNMAPITSQSPVGDNVTLQCDDGFAFSVDLAASTEERAVLERNVTCEDDPTSIHGQWPLLPACAGITCGTPPDIPNTQKESSNMTYGSEVKYESLSGYWFGTNVFTRNGTCNKSAVWTYDMASGISIAIESSQPYEMSKYIGCLSRGTLVATEHNKEAPTQGVLNCLTHCLNKGYRFAAVNSTTCACGNELPDEFDTLSDTECNATCLDYQADPLATNRAVFCGGMSTQQSVYATKDGCHKDVELSRYTGEHIIGLEFNTCKERCRAQETSHALFVFKDNMCYCANYTDNLGDEFANENMCSSNSTSAIHYTRVYDIANVKVTSKTCTDLFTNRGVIMHGDYYLKDPYRMERCNFTDGTACEDGWLGFQGHCYQFYNEEVLNFTGARNYCMHQEAELVSILNEDEFKFLSDIRNKFIDFAAKDSDSKSVPFWWIGLYDSKNTSLFTWIDGSIMTYNKFKAGEPDDRTHACAVDAKDDGYKWYDADCSDEYSVMCKKQNNVCWYNTTLPVVSTFKKTEQTMTVTFCLELCKGQSAQYAVIQNDTCDCSDTDPTPLQVGKVMCSNPCPGDTSQFCGGSSDIYSIITVGSSNPVQSCEELQVVGVGNGTFLVQPENEAPGQLYCGIPECPYSWVLIKDHCYKFNPSQTESENAIQSCATDDAYTVVIETEEELQAVLDTAMNISMYSGRDHWRIGLQALGFNGGLYRWANGRIFDTPMWNNTFSGLDGPYVVLPTANYTGWTAVAERGYAYICEKGNEYVGCYSTAGMVNDSVIEDYSRMTIQLCVETCRVTSHEYAFLSKNFCSCENSLTTQKSGECTTVCTGQRNQVCGGDGVMSVYNVSMYSLNATSCEDIFKAGIFKSNFYMVNGRVTSCYLTDNTTVCYEDWLAIEGECYTHLSKQTGLTRTETCEAHGGIPTSLSTLTQYETLVSYLRRINFGASYSRVFTGVSPCYYNLNVFISPDGRLIDPALTINDVLHIADLFDQTDPYISFRIERGLDLKEDGGVICKESKDTPTCYERESQEDMDGFPNMEIGQCKQHCATKPGVAYALMGNNFCSCLTTSELSSRTSVPLGTVKCDVPCYVHTDQNCGDGTVGLALNMSNIQYADSCQTLYNSAIFYNDTYRLQAPTGSGTVDQQCGFTDTTSCPVTWFGRSGACVKVMKPFNSFKDSRGACFYWNSYLYNPGVHNTLVTDIVTKTGLLDGLTDFWTGIKPIFDGLAYLRSDGGMMLSETAGKATGRVKYVLPSSDWLDGSDKMSYICETNADYLGCHYAKVSPFSVNYTVIGGNSLTMCIQWCQGHGMTYAATSLGSCGCSNSISSELIVTTKQCTEACDGADTQPCGNSYKEGAYYSIMKIDNADMAPSCQVLFRHGVIVSGHYQVQPNSSSPIYNVTCFILPAPMALVTQADLDSIKASTSDVNNAMFEYPFHLAWAPTTSVVNEYLVLTTLSDFLLTGIILMGNRDGGVDSYVTEYELTYSDVVTGQSTTYTQPTGNQQIPTSCTNGVDWCTTYLSDPVIGRWFKVSPIKWQTSIAMKMTLLGIVFSAFNHTQTYIGCFLDTDGAYTVIATGTTNVDIDTCRQDCQKQGYPFASIDEQDDCLCRDDAIGNGGFTSNDNCTLQSSKGYRTGTGSLRAVYRTYVTLGVVGDCRVGKTLLVVSYTANYVYPEYKPTAVNCYWTNLMVNGCTVDLRIWDNSGSDEYVKLRPLSYPQTECFLVCFSLQSRASFENIERKWAPEIQRHTNAVPFIIVGCKRDKHCAAPDPVLLINATITNTTYHYTPHVHAFRTNVTYTCLPGYELSDGSTQLSSVCLHNNTWSSLPESACKLVTCPVFTVDNATLQIFSNEYNGTARVTCVSGLWAENSQSEMTVTCQQNKTWSSIPTCKAENLRYQSLTYTIHESTVRDPAAMYQGGDARSSIDCASLCAEDYTCKGASYSHTDKFNGYGGECRLYRDVPGAGELTSDTNSMYMKKGP